MRYFHVALMICLSVYVVGCGGSAGYRSDETIKKISGSEIKKVVPVSGKVTIDGEGKNSVLIYLNKGGPTDPIATATTEKDGVYCWTTYRPCDGLEPGEYTLTFKHIPNMRPSGKGEDLLKGRYADPATSEFKLTVEEGKPQKNVDYPLNTK